MDCGSFGEQCAWRRNLASGYRPNSSGGRATNSSNGPCPAHRNVCRCPTDFYTSRRATNAYACSTHSDTGVYATDSTPCSANGNASQKSDERVNRNPRERQYKRDYRRAQQ